MNTPQNPNTGQFGASPQPPQSGATNSQSQSETYIAPNGMPAAPHITQGSRPPISNQNIPAKPQAGSFATPQTAPPPISKFYGATPTPPQTQTTPPVQNYQNTPPQNVDFVPPAPTPVVQTPPVQQQVPPQAQKIPNPVTQAVPNNNVPPPIRQSQTPPLQKMAPTQNPTQQSIKTPLPPTSTPIQQERTGLPSTPPTPKRTPPPAQNTPAPQKQPVTTTATTKKRLGASLFAKKKSPADEVLIRPLRTYEDDVKNAITSQSMSTARMMMAEQQRKNVQVEQEESDSIDAPKNRFFVFLTLILVVGSLGIFGYFFLNKAFFQVDETGSDVTIVRPSFITVDSQKDVIVENRNSINVFNEVKQIVDTPFQQGTIKEILLTRTQRVDNEGGAIERKVTLTTPQLFNLLNTRAPEELVRSLSKDFIFGVYATEYNDPFFIFQVNDHDNAYGHMLEWEPKLARDIKDVFTVFNIDELATPGTVTTISIQDDVPADEPEPEENTQSDNETRLDDEALPEQGPEPDPIAEPEPEPEIQIDSFNPRLFEDVVVENRDLRAIFRQSGEFVYYYSFIDEETLIMATHESTVAELVKRLRSNRLLKDQ